MTQGVTCSAVMQRRQGERDRGPEPGAHCPLLSPVLHLGDAEEPWPEVPAAARPKTPGPVQQRHCAEKQGVSTELPEPHLPAGPWARSLYLSEQWWRDRLLSPACG